MIRWRSVVYILGVLDFALGAAMLFPLGVALLLKELEEAFRPLAISSVLIFAGGGASLALTRQPPKEISHREGFLIVALGWINAAALGALPYWLGGLLPHYVDAFFESTSGFTTTGATVLSAIEGTPRSLLLWRATTHWLGGMGIIVLSLAILPLLGVGGMQLYRAEVPGPVPDKLKPRIAETAKTLWKVYVFFTAAEVFLLMAGGIGPLDAVAHAFATLATGGFSTRNLSVESFHSPYVDGVVLFFMLAAGANFALHYWALKGRPTVYWKNSEFRFFLFLFLLFTSLISIQLWQGEVYPSLGKAIRFASFQVASILTTTGFTTADYEKWPTMSCVILFLLMFVGGCAGSTGGGMKCVRVLILLKSGYRELRRLIHPRAIISVKVDGRTVPRDVLESIWGFFSLYVLIFLSASMIMASLGLDLVSAFVSVAACIGNIGPGLGSVGPADNYAHIPSVGKWVLSLCMIVGRLEVYTLILLLIPEFWKK
jgi:trk system potassium uptake protein TrkH